MREPQPHKTAANRKTEENYDFPETDCCDFGYALEQRPEAKTPAPPPAE